VWYTDFYGWCIVPVISWDVGNFSLVVDRIYSGAAQLSFEWAVPEPWSVFDQVLVDLKSSKPRSGVDKEAPIRWTATYAFDGAPFQGQIILDENLTSPTVGNRTYQVAAVIDELYNLTVFESDSLEIIFDRVLVTLNASDERVNVGSEAEIEWTATYEYDQTPFHGWVEFNDTLVQDEAGIFCYSVGSVGDAQYDVEAFVSNAVDVIFDEVTVKIRADDSRLDVGEEVDITNKSMDEIARLGIVKSNQIIQDFESLSIRDSLLLSLSTPEYERFYKIFSEGALLEETKEQIEEYLDYFHFEDPDGHALSAGEKKLLDIVRCLLLKPKFLLMDEPTAGLPEDQTKKVMDLMKKKTKEEDMSILIVEHDLDLIWNVSEIVYFMAEGEILVKGTPEEIRKDETVAVKYMGVSHV